MKIGILGGTFNPPHIGHLILAQEVSQKIGLNKVIFIPTNIPPHKESHNVDAYHRYNMVKLAIKGNNQFDLSSIEIKRGGVSYTIDTVRNLKKQYPKAEFYLILGSDLANDLPTWKYYEGLKKIVKIIVVKRRKYPLRDRHNFIIFNMTQIAISSSGIRSLIKKGISVKYFIAENVYRYIKKNKLYK